MKSGEVELQTLASGTSLEKIAEEIPDGSPRFIVYRHYIDLDGKTKKTLLMFIYYNPVTTNTQLKKLCILCFHHVLFSLVSAHLPSSSIMFSWAAARV